MQDIQRNAIKEKLNTYEGQAFLSYYNRNGQCVNELAQIVKEAMSEQHLSVTVAKGFLEYMKLVIEDCSHIQIQK